MLTAFRQEMGESNKTVNGRHAPKPNGYIYGLKWETVWARVKKAQEEASPQAWPEPVGPMCKIEVTPEFHEFLALGNGDAYWTTIGKHAGDLNLGSSPSELLYGA